MPSGDDRPDLYRFAHPAMATTFEVLIAAKSRAYAEAVADAAFSEVGRLERELSRFVPDSDIARINRLRPGDTVQVGLDAFECLQLAEAVWRETRGAFDVTVGGLLPGPERNTTAEGACPVGMSLLELDVPRRRVGVRAEGVRIDLGALGKGYAVDQVVEVLAEWGISRGLIHAGQSSVYALGDAYVSDPRATSASAHPAPLPVPASASPHADRLRTRTDSGWLMPLRDPRNHDLAFGEVRLCNASLSGSGRALHGEHILDPRTRLPARPESIGAWAVVPSAAMSDAFSTAFMILPPEEVELCCRRVPGLSAVLALGMEGTLNIRSFGPSTLMPGTSATNVRLL